MAQASFKWFDVVSEVQRANIRQQQQLKERERQINRKYLRNYGEDIEKHKHQKQKRQHQIKEERSKVEKLVKDQQERIKIDKSVKLARQLKFQEDNKQIIETIKNNQYKQRPYIDNPFFRLMEQSDKRKQAFKQKLKLQNQINHIQEQMKISKNKEFKQHSKIEMSRFHQKIQLEYDQRNRNRQAFQKRYLKLNKFEESSIRSEKLLKPKDNIEQDYLMVLDHQINMKQQSKKQKETLDEQLYKFNKNIDHPDSSPAFLGRTPMSHDRRRQLSYLDRSIQSHKEVKYHVKTEGNQVNYKTQVDSSHLESKNLNQINKTFQINLNNRSNQKIYHISNNVFGVQLEKQPQKINQISYLESIQPKISRKQYKRFDIIEGKNKIISI